jgi:hypothetical protein
MTPTVARWVEKRYRAKDREPYGETRYALRLDPQILMVSDGVTETLHHAHGALQRYPKAHLQFTGVRGYPMDEHRARSYIYVPDDYGEGAELLSEIPPELLGPDPTWEYVAWRNGCDGKEIKSCVGFSKPDRLIRHRATLEPTFSKLIGMSLEVSGEYNYLEAGPSEKPNLDPTGYLTLAIPKSLPWRLNESRTESLERYLDELDTMWVRGEAHSFERLLVSVFDPVDEVSAELPGRCATYRGRWDNWRSRITKTEVIHGVRAQSPRGGFAIRPVWGTVAATVLTTARLDSMPFAVSIVSTLHVMQRWGRWRFLGWDVTRKLTENRDIQRYFLNERR